MWLHLDDGCYPQEQSLNVWFVVLSSSQHFSWARGKFNNASAHRHSVFGYLSLFVTCKAWHRYNKCPRALVLLNSPNCVHTFACNWHQPFLNLYKENDRRKKFIIISTNVWGQDLTHDPLFSNQSFFWLHFLWGLANTRTMNICFAAADHLHYRFCFNKLYQNVYHHLRTESMVVLLVCLIWFFTSHQQSFS